MMNSTRIQPEFLQEVFPVPILEYLGREPQFHHFILLLVNDPWRQQMMIQMLGPFPPTQVTQMELSLLALDMVQSMLLYAFRK